MTIHDPSGNGYQFRREYRHAAQQWLAAMAVDLFVSLSVPQNIGLERGRQILRHWFACLDSHYLGKGWAHRRSDERTVAIVFPENIMSNLHYHCLMRLPSKAQSEGIANRSSTLEKFWLRAVLRGTCHVRSIRDAGAARYVTKQLVRPGYWQHYILASEFHSDRGQRAETSPRARPAQNSATAKTAKRDTIII
jgi:hypothetical protein